MENSSLKKYLDERIGIHWKLTMGCFFSFLALVILTIIFHSGNLGGLAGFMFLLTFGEFGKCEGFMSVRDFLAKEEVKKSKEKNSKNQELDKKMEETRAKLEKVKAITERKRKEKEAIK